MQDIKLGQLLLQEGLVKEAELNKALAKQKDSNQRLGEILIEMEVLDEITLLRTLARQHRTQYLTAKKLSELIIPDAVLKLVPVHICEKYGLIPIQFKKAEKSLLVVMSDPNNVAAIDEVRFVSGIANIKPLISLGSAVQGAINKWYKGEKSAEIEIGAEDEIREGFEIYGGSGHMVELEGSESQTQKAEVKAKPEEEDLIDFQLLIKDEKKEAQDSGLVLGGVVSEGKDSGTKKEVIGKEPAIIIEEISDVGSTPAETIKLEPAEDMATAKPAGAGEIKRALEQRYRKRMVVVERHDQIRKFIIKLFTSEGYQVRGFKSLNEAYAELGTGGYDFLIIKERSLEESGVEFEERFRGSYPKVELCIIKDYGSAVIGETRTAQRLTSSFFETLDVLLGLLEMEGHNVQGHAHNIAKYARLIGNKLELGLKDLDAITLAAYIHDLGKKGMKPYSILEIDATSDPAEIMEQAEIPLKLLGAAKFPFDLAGIIKNQYERWDGRGIPNGLRGEEIPIGARILTLVDSYEMLTNRGLSGQQMEPGDALEQMNRQAGKIFDPKLVPILMSVVRDEIYLKQVKAAQDKILIADTEIDLTTLLELRLVKEGFEVIIARNGNEALEKAREEKPSLIITEVDLPGKTGLEFISEMTKMEEIGSTPFVFLSRRDDPRIVTQALSLGAEDYISKPVKVDVFCAKINTMLSRLKAEKKVAVAQPTGVSGSLSEMSLPDIIQILGAGHKTGKIILKNKDQSAEIHMEDGRIVNALIDNLKGEEAFYKILYWNEGNFTIDPNIVITERLINLSNDSLMLEGYRRMDEALHGKETPDQDINMDGGEFV